MYGRDLCIAISGADSRIEATTSSSHISYGRTNEVVVIAQEMGSGISEDGDEVDVVRVPHKSLVLLRCLSPGNVHAR